MTQSIASLPLIVFVVLVSACGGSAPPAPAPAQNTGACEPSECGPAPGMPSQLCADGVTTSGPGACERGADGACGYAIRECPTAAAPRACGGMVAAQNACPANEFCDYPVEAMCGAADGMGVCHARPEVCTEQHAPVCGCDEHTYPNACAAATQGVSVAARGECPQRLGAVDETCGTRGVPPCGEGLFCDFPATANCGRADAPGVCKPKPVDCDARMRRVCGCDATTYPNACSANLAGVSVERQGACAAR